MERQMRRRSDARRIDRPNGNTPAPLTVREHVARRAFDLYCARGCEDGHDVDDWLHAECELRASYEPRTSMASQRSWPLTKRERRTRLKRHNNATRTHLTRPLKFREPRDSPLVALRTGVQPHPSRIRRDAGYAVDAGAGGTFVRRKLLGMQARP
jgi:hypothetical protein